MTPGFSARRRALLRALAGAILVAAPRRSFGQTGDAENVEDAPRPGTSNGEEGGDKNGNEGTAKAGTGTVLTVVVSGNDEPVAQAEVKVKFPPAVGGEATLPTNLAGEALFNCPGTGTATVRVIATGWKSVLQEVMLQEGPQRLAIQLTALPNAR